MCIRDRVGPAHAVWLDDGRRRVHGDPILRARLGVVVVVNLGAFITCALPGLRAQAESMMRDSCTITRPGGGETWDDATGGYLSGSSVILYSGRCRVRRPNVAEREALAGDADWTLMGAVVSLSLIHI